MAASIMIHRACHTIIRRAVRAVGTSRVVMGSPVNNVLTGGNNFHMSNQFFSWAAVGPQKLADDDQEFIKHLKSEIKLSYSYDQVPEVPENFPFEIKDIPVDQRSIVLRRQLAGEKIEVEVYGPFICPYEGSSKGGGGGDDDEDDDDGGGDGDDIHVLLRVKISKKNGKTLECHCQTTNDSIEITHIDLDNCNIKAPRFWMMEDRQKFWRDFLARRGINGGIVDFLVKYMRGKCNRDYTIFLKNIKNFVEE